MKPLGIICPNQADATSLYRALGPFSELTESSPEFRLFFTNEYNWSTISLMSAVFLQRPFTQNHVLIVRKCKEMRKPVWIDYDDDLLNVTPDNYSYDNYGSPEVQSCIIQLLQMADIVTVSTPYLMDQYVTFLTKNNLKVPEFVVLPNAYNTGMFKGITRENQAKRILWRGTETHIKDVMSVREDIIHLAEKYPDYEWTFIGMRPWFLEGLMPKGKLGYHPPIDPITYMNKLIEFKPDIVMVPLWDSSFNRSKSNIAWIEATHCGAVTVAPDFEEWKRPGVHNYAHNSQGDFHWAMDVLMRENGERKFAMWADSRDYINEHLLVRHINHIRLNIFQRLQRGDRQSTILQTRMTELSQ